MTNAAIRNRQVEELLEDTRKVVRRSREIIQQTDKLAKQSRELMRDFDFLDPRRTQEKQALR